MSERRILSPSKNSNASFTADPIHQLYTHGFISVAGSGHEKASMTVAIKTFMVQIYQNFRTVISTVLFFVSVFISTPGM